MTAADRSTGFTRSLSRILSALRYDLSFQWRHGFYYVYFVIVVLYALALRFFFPPYRETLAIFLLFSDTSVLGFFFIGGIVLLERAQNTFESLFVTPLRIFEYFAAKVASLTFIAAVMSLAVVLGGYGFPKAILPLILGVIGSSVFFTLFGLAVAARVKTINGYFGASFLLMFIVMLPLLGYFGVAGTPLFRFFPTNAVLYLYGGAFFGMRTFSLLVDILVLTGWIIAAGFWAAGWFRKYVLVQIGEERWKIV